MRELQERLKEVESHLQDGNFVSQDGPVLEGQEVVKDLLDRCWKWSELVLERSVADLSILCERGGLLTQRRKGKIEERFKEPYDSLLDIRNQLERLSMTQAWSLRETDLFQYQRKLDRIDEARVNGNFIGGDGQPAEIHAQRVWNHDAECLFFPFLSRLHDPFMIFRWLTHGRHFYI